MLAILDFLYFGETNIFQGNLETFLAIVEELHLKGLIETKSDETMQNYQLPNQRSKERKCGQKARGKPWEVSWVFRIKCE